MIDYPIKVTEDTEDVVPSEPGDGLPQQNPIPFASDDMDMDIKVRGVDHVNSPARNQTLCPTNEKEGALGSL